MKNQFSQLAPESAPPPWRYWLTLVGLVLSYCLASAVYRPWQAARADLPAAYVRLASEFAQAGRLTHAVRQCRAALELDSDAVLARYNLAVFLRDQKQNADAQAELLRLVNRTPSFSPAWVLLGTILAEKGDTAGAARAWQAAGDHPLARENLRRLQARPQP